MTTRIVIIGGGPAGYEAALVAADRDTEVTVVDSDGVGGACVLYDCVPSKTFIASTGVRTELRRAAGLGGRTPLCIIASRGRTGAAGALRSAGRWELECEPPRL